MVIGPEPGFRLADKRKTPDSKSGVRRRSVRSESLLAAIATPYEAGQTDQAGAQQSHRARLRNHRTGRCESRTGTTACIVEHTDVYAEASDLVNIGIENGEAQGCGELLART